MSQAARDALVQKLVFQRDSQRADLLSSNRTNSTLVALLGELVAKGHVLEITAVRSDHHDDGPRGHAGGRAADCWPLATSKPGDYLDAGDPRFRALLSDAAASRWIFQIGLAGAADSHANRIAAGTTCFEDAGGDHVHLGSTNA